MERQKDTSNSLNFNDQNQWPSLQNETGQPAKCGSFSNVAKSDNTPKFMFATYADRDNEWMFLNHRHLYKDILKKPPVGFATHSGAEDQLVDNIKSWTLLDNEISSNSSYFSEEEDCFGQPVNVTRSPGSISSSGAASINESSSGSLLGASWLVW